jgi:hypothetical protein
MFKWIMAGCVASVIFPASALAQGACTAPEKPKMPINGAILSATELDNAADMVTGYSKASRVYQGCLDKVISKPETHSREEWRAALKAYNSAAPGVEEVWDTYQKLSDDWVKAHLATKNNAGK